MPARNPVSKNVQDVVTKAKAQPNTVIYGTELGGYSHLQGLMFAKQADVQLKVDVGSASDKITSLLGGRIDLSAISFGPVKDYATTGDMAMVAQFSKDRNLLLGDIKTFNEQGLKFDMEKPYVIAFPKGTNPAIIKKMADVMQQITKDPAYAKALEDGFKAPVSFLHKHTAAAELNKVCATNSCSTRMLRQKK